MSDEILVYMGDDECIQLLIKMTNFYIEYRDQVFDGVVNQRTGKVENEDDLQEIAEMDKNINEVIAFLED
jgi:hypothetical protein